MQTGKARGSRLLLEQGADMPQTIGQLHQTKSRPCSVPFRKRTRERGGGGDSDWAISRDRETVKVLSPVQSLSPTLGPTDSRIYLLDSKRLIVDRARTRHGGMRFFL